MTHESRDVIDWKKALCAYKHIGYINNLRKNMAVSGWLSVSVSASHTVGRVFASRPGHTKDHHKNGTNCLPACHTMR